MIHKTCHLFQYIGIHTSEILQFSDLHNRIQGAQFTPPFYIGFFIHPRWWYSQLIFHHISPLSTSSAVKKPCHCASRPRKHLQKQTPHWHQKVVPARYCYHLTLQRWVSEQDQRRRNLPCMILLVKTNQFSTIVFGCFWWFCCCCQRSSFANKRSATIKMLRCFSPSCSNKLGRQKTISRWFWLNLWVGHETWLGFNMIDLHDQQQNRWKKKTWPNNGVPKRLFGSPWKNEAWSLKNM